MILADQNVVLQTRREDEEKHLLRRVQLKGERLMYDARNSEVNVTGRGTMLSEDYRPPDTSQAKSPEGEESTDNVERPSQTAFEWHKSMQYAQDKRVVALEGQATMVHRSGDKVILVDQINKPAWPDKLPVGRKTVLTCERMMAKFAPPAKDKTSATRPTTRPTTGPTTMPASMPATVPTTGPTTMPASMPATVPTTGPTTMPATMPTTGPTTRPATKPTTAADNLDFGPRLGRLELFSAMGDVNMRDGWRQVLGQRIIYHRDPDVVIVWGFLPDQPAANASVFYEDPEKGQSQSWSSPKIIWYRKDDRIVTEKVTGTGVR